MQNSRFSILQQIMNREKVQVNVPNKRISEYFGENVFNDTAMQNYLNKATYKAVKNAINHGKKIDRAIAEQVAAGMKTWAIEKGAKSYTHWFQPLTGATAEKHDSFFVPNFKEDGGIETFSGSELSQQEPDASSFPSGGIRATFEARGYTAWDPSSPAFIMDIEEGKTLCIPTIFVSYTGHALDYKAPLLKSMHFLEEAALPVVNLFDRHATKVTPTLGWEQEYFLIDEALFYARPDLVTTGRTVLGSAPARGQQLDDHYFGSIPERVYAFMVDLEHESHKLGIPVRTRHNEVAPSQFELAPMFEEVNVAVDHNQLIMDLIERVAKRHKLRALLHEKPYAGINGSGKHNNWSLSTDTGKNLLSPGSTPKTNIMFLTFFVNVIKAVNEYADLLRASIASAGNDHRLGANEAPPAIISIFIGSHLTNVLNEIEKRVDQDKYDDVKNADLKLDIHKIIPDLLLDNTDRNRTSPFAFTGNKFEIRAVGSTTNCASPMIVMNTIMANQLKAFYAEVNALIKGGEKKEGAIMLTIRKYIAESKAILFEGDNYSDEWAKEAEKRGLSNVKTTAHALGFLNTDKARKLFVDNNIFSEVELDARNEIEFEKYAMKIQIESKVLEDMATTQVIPAGLKYQQALLKSIKGLKKLGLKKQAEEQTKILANVADQISDINQGIEKLRKEYDKAAKLGHADKQAKALCDKVLPVFTKIRNACDSLETSIDDKLWPLPKYRELLFVR